MSDRRAVIVEAIDDYHKPEADALLKVLDRNDKETVLILLASDRKAVRPSILSRCEAHRVGQFHTQGVADTMASLTTGQGARRLDLVELMVAAVNGVPGRIAPTWSRMKDLLNASLAEARAGLGCGWAPAVQHYLLALTGDDEPDCCTLATPPDATVAEQVRRVRLVLHQLRINSLHPDAPGHLALDPALVLLGDDYWSKLIEMLRQRAQARGVSWEELWLSLARLWLSSDITDPVAFAEAGKTTWLIVHGQDGLTENEGTVAAHE
jgi:hypothetical protein